MSDEDPPDDLPSEPPSRDHTRESTRDRVRSRLESVIPDLLKRAVELGVEKARESPDNLKQFVHDLKVPKELAHYLFQQVDDTKNGLFRVVAKEMRDFLEHTNFAGEVQKLLTTVQFEVNTTIRFTPNDGREPRKSDGDDDGGDGKEGDEAGGDADSTAPGHGREDRPRDAGKRDSERPDDGRHPLPKPEVKTSVRMHRDGGAGGGGGSNDPRDRSARRRGSRRPT